MKCKKIRGQKRTVCIGDLDKLITLQDRNITPPVYGSQSFDETFSGDNDVWAMIKTVNGKTVFDGVNADVNVTHEIYIIYDSSVTTSTWIEYDGRRFDIVPNGVEDLDERKEFLKLLCNERGSTANEATKA